MKYDQVLVMGDGKVIHSGSPAEAIPGFRAPFVLGGTRKPYIKYADTGESQIYARIR